MEFPKVTLQAGLGMQHRCRLGPTDVPFPVYKVTTLSPQPYVFLQPGLLLVKGGAEAMIMLCLSGPRDTPWGHLGTSLFKCTTLLLCLLRAVQSCRTSEKALSIFRIYREPFYQQAYSPGLISLILTAGCGWWARIVNFT